MSPSFRRSLRFETVSVDRPGQDNISPSTVRVAHVGARPRATYVSLTIEGFQYRQKLKRIEAPAHSTPEASLAEAQRRLWRLDWFKPYVFTCCVAVVLFVRSSALEAAGIAVLAAIILGIPVYHWAAERRTARLIYDIDQPRLIERVALANAVGQQLQKAQSLWLVSSSVATPDWKRHGGASLLIKRSAICVRVGSLPRVELNIESWCVPVGPQKLLFLPDRLLVWKGSVLAGLAYDDLDIEVSTSRNIEEPPVPNDARQVGTTWRFVNKDGSPDRRYNDNAQLPVMEYGQLEIRSSNGAQIVLAVSSEAAAWSAASALKAIRDLAMPSGGVAAGPVPSISEAASTPEALPPFPSAGIDMARAVAVATILKYVTAADRRITDDEVALAQDRVAQLVPPEHQLHKMLIQGFRSVSSDPASISSAIAALRTTSIDFRGWVLETAERLCFCDGKVTPKEREKLAEVKAGLGTAIQDG